MKRSAVVLLAILAALALGLPACGRGDDGSASQKAAADQARLLDDALGDIGDLREQTQELEAELATLQEELAQLQDERAQAATRLGRASDRLWASLAKLREAVSEAKASGASASSEASSALANVGAAARDLRILENRFEYHLRQHGRG